MFHQNVVMRQTPWFLFWQKLRETRKKKHTEHRQTVNACVSEREGKRSLGSHPTVYVCVSKLQCVRLCCALAGWWLGSAWAVIHTASPILSLSALPCSFCALNLEGSVHRSCLLKPRGKTFNCLCTLVGRLLCSFQCSNFYFFFFKCDY